LGHLRIPAEELEVPSLDGGPEAIHLTAGVVEVVLAFDLMTGEGQQSCQRIADRGVPRVADREGAGGVRGHELHLDPATRRLTAAVAIALVDDLAEHVVEPL